ncbi:MAG: DUF885 domain-containing protein [Gammaproteobacteria bacterium]|nr:DUF885 domain-containing protein [Gammaproteobacteria bacterium]
MKYMFSLAILVLLFGCSPAGNQVTDANPAKAENISETQRLNSWLDEEFINYLDFSPLAKTRLGDKSDYDELDDVSEAMADKRLDWRRRSVAEMKSNFDRDKLTTEGRLSWDLWVYMLNQAEEGVPFRRHAYLFGRRGPHTSLPNNLINYHKVDDLSDMQAYISRLNQSQRYLLQYLERAQLSAADGIRAPYFDYEVAIIQSKRVLKGEPFTSEGSSALWSDITLKIDKLHDAGVVTDAQVTELTDKARKALLEKLKPAYEDIVHWLQSDLSNVVRDAKGVWALPNGKAFYVYALAQRTTLPLTADEIHETGLSEVARIQAEMEGIKSRVGFEGSLSEFFVYLREDERFYFPNTDEGRAGYLALANQYLDAMKQKLPEFFGILPKAGLEVRRVEAFREHPGAAAHYMRGTKDGSRPGVFYAHLADMKATAKYRLENLAYHEGLPGHHHQGSIQQELEGIPRFRTYHGYTAYSEGWGLYSELLGKEMGFYEDPYSDFGRLTGELWRAIRLVVDTGIHAKQWTEQQSIDYALLNSPKPEIAVRSEIRRYFNSPAQATAYKIGMLKILELRAKAKNDLGDKFDIRDFHDTVLGGGSLPMSLLERRINEWIGAQ